MSSFTRRLALKLLGIGSSVLAWNHRRTAAIQPPKKKSDLSGGFQSDWHQSNDRIWLGKDFWANPMEDWRIVNGAAECQTGGGNRNVHLLTHQLTNPEGTLQMSVRIQQVELQKRDGGAGFRLGVTSDLNEYRSNCFAGGGINAGVVRGELTLGRRKLPLTAGDSGTRLTLSGRPAGDQYSLTLSSVSEAGQVQTSLTGTFLGDRQWKSGPERVETGSGRADHVRDPDFDTSTLDKPGLVLLGERQEAFLEHWVNDWRGHEMKVVLSQTVFAGVATHHGGYDGYLKADLDSGGWPQTARNNAIRIMRRGKPLHINGDQHLTSLVQYGVDQQRDSCWSFCTPAIAAGYPRWWRPDELGMPHQNRPEHGLPNTGEYLDGFGNKVYVYAIGNPIVPTEKNRYKVAHQKGSGFGLVTIDTRTKTYHVEAFRFLVDPTDGNPDNQFPGWPVTLHQKENAGDNVVS